MIIPGWQRDFISSTYSRLWLEDNDYRLIYVDDCQVSMNNSSFYNCSPRDYTAIQEINSDNNIMSFIVDI